MKDFLLAYCTSDAGIVDDQNNRRYWGCEADDYEHAVEQLMDAESKCNFREPFKGPQVGADTPEKKSS